MRVGGTKFTLYFKYDCIVVYYTATGLGRNLSGAEYFLRTEVKWIATNLHFDRRKMFITETERNVTKFLVV